MRARRALLCAALALAACEDPAPPVHPRPPRILRFDVTPFEVAPGTAVTVAWNVAEASTVSLQLGDSPADAVPVEGSRSVVVTEDVTMVLTAEGAGGTTRAVIGAGVSRARTVAITHLAITPTRARPGDPVEISWATENATRVELRWASGGIIVPDPRPAGAHVLRTDSSFGVELYVEGFGGPLVRTASVTISEAAPLITRLEADPPVIAASTESILGWAVERANHVELEELRTDGTRNVLLDVDVELETGSIRLLGSAGTRTLVLRATGPGGTASESTRLVVLEPRPPIITSFTATPTISGPGGDVVLGWETRDTAWVELTGGPFAGTVLAPSGQLTFEATAGARIELAAHGTESPAVARETRSVGLDARRPELAVVVAPRVVALGDPLTIEWQTLRADRVTLATDGGLVIATSTATSGRATFTPPASAVLVARAWNTFGPTTRLVPFHAAPPVTIGALSVSSTIARGGRPVAIRWRTAGATGGVLRDAASTWSVPLDSAEIAAGERWIATLTDVGRAEVVLDAWNGGLSATASVGVDVLFTATQAREAEPNDRSETANGPWLGATFDVDGALAGSDVDAYALVMPFRGRIAGTTAPASGCVGDVAIDLYEVTPTLALVGPVHTIAGPGCAVLDAAIDPSLALVGRSLVLALRAPGARGTPVPYTLAVHYRGIVCGDGVVDRLEDCDDGGTAGGDGCSATCTDESLDEVEPNEGAGNPIVVGVPFSGFLAADDLDRLELAVDVADAGAFDVVLEAPTPGTCGLAAHLSLFDATGRLVAEAAGGAGTCPRLSGPAVVLAAGRYTLFVEPARDAAMSEARGRYVVTVLDR
ncbi:hypothetical protein L6R52_15720 [Myxococcota bacterium]|nr:hypothetical protein [Myxococcota bacterium]